MRILQLELRAFGCFTGVTLDFSGRTPGLHVIHGVNEAGKSTALRAIGDLLYGIPGNTDDDFLHKANQLRIAARLAHSSGQELFVVRRKGNKNTLQDVEEEPVPDAALSPYLGDITRETFDLLHGIGHQSLREGAEQLLSDKGEVGASLFAAGLGVTDLNRILEALQEEADDLWRPGASNPSANAAIAKYKEAVREIAGSAASGREWNELTSDLAEQREKHEGIVKRLRELRSEAQKLERLRKTVPLVADRAELLRRRQELGEVVLLPEDFSMRHRDAARRRDEAKDQERTLSGEEQLLTTQISGLEIPQGVLDAAEAVRALYRRLEQHAKNGQEVERLRSQQRQLQEQAERVLMDLGAPVPLAEAERLRITVPRRMRIRELAQSHAATKGQQRDRATATKELEGSLKDLTERLAAALLPRDVSELRSAVQRVRAHGKLDAQFAQARKAEGDAAKEADNELARLPLWKGDLTGVQRLPVPSPESIQHWEDELRSLDGEIKAYEDDARSADADCASLDAQIRALRTAGDVPVEAALIDARKRRDSGWYLVRRAWLDGRPDSEAERVFDPKRKLPEAYEEAKRAADEVADRLRRESERVAKLTGLLADLDRRSRDAELQRAGGTGTGKLREKTAQGWTDLWRPCGIAPLSPREMRVWLGQHAKVVQQARKAADFAAEASRQRDHVASLIASLGVSLQAIGETGVQIGEGLESVLEHCETIVDANEKLARDKQALEDRLKDAEGQLGESRRQEALAEGELQQWTGNWKGALREAGLSEDFSPAQAEGILEANQRLFDALDKAAEGASEAEGLGLEIDQFEAEARDLAARCAPDLSGRKAAEVASALHQRLDKGGKDKVQRGGLEAQQREKRVNLGRVRETQAEMGRAIQEMCAKVGCTDEAGLDRAEELSEKARGLVAEIAQAERTLVKAGEADLDSLVREAEGADRDSIPGQIEELQARIQAEEGEQTKANESIGALGEKRKTMDGGGAAADHALTAQTHLADARTHLARWVRLQVALALVRAEMERYREKNQGPVLARASALFARLTRHSFIGLDVEMGEDDVQELVGVRAAGDKIGVGEMSDGARDQFYLGLRIASLEERMRGREAMPFIVDDVLVHFDEGRARVALEVLADLARTTQVLFFTHHQHLVELARSSAPAEILMVHELPAGPSAPVN